MVTYATWNPEDTNAEIALSNGNLTTVKGVSNQYRGTRATIGKSSGKWYWEVSIINLTHICIGVGSLSANIGGVLGGDVYGWGYYGSNGNKYHLSFVAYGLSFTTGAIIGVALDMDNGEIWWSKNGVWQASGDPETGANPAYTGFSGAMYPMLSHRYINESTGVNFGASAFSYDVPAGFNAGVFEEEAESPLLKSSMFLSFNS